MRATMTQSCSAVFVAARDAAGWQGAIDRLAGHLRQGEHAGAHEGALAPHFAYGVVTKAEYDRLHALHVANHLAPDGAAP